MNSKIFTLIIKNLQIAFNLPKYQKIAASIGATTAVDQLPWTPARYRKFKDAVFAELQLESEYVGTVELIVQDLDRRYTHRFFSEIWKPSINEYEYTGWQLVDEINRLNPESVLDVGCGYHLFKGRIQNIVGIDPYNDQADYEVDILEYCVRPKSYDVIIALGSINFNRRQDVEKRFAHCVNLLKPGGKFYLRANPGVPHKIGPYVDIFPWSFEVVKELEERYRLHLDTFKHDTNNRLYFVYTKLQ